MSRPRGPWLPVMENNRLFEQRTVRPHGSWVHTRGGYEGPHMEHKTLAADAQNDQEVSHRANTSLCVWNTCIACDTNQQATHPDTEH